MVCICCCAAYLERDIDCVGTQYSQMVLEMTGFGPSGSCGCPNELGTIVVDFNDSTQDTYTFCVQDANTYWTAEVTLYGASAAKGFYNTFLKAHAFAPGTGAVAVEIFSHYTAFGQQYKDIIYTISIVTYPIGTECESCSDFLSRISGAVYEAFSSRSVNALGCNNITIDWYLQ